MQNKSNYKLRCTLPGHSKDVRCVAFGYFGEKCIISGSRDKTAKLWTPEGLGFVCNQTYATHEGFVSSVAVILPSPSYINGAIATGCQDGKIRIFDPHSSSPIETLVGHKDTVCSVVVKEKFLFSGSWDKTARVWQDSSSVLTLSGHTAAIWAVDIIETADSVSNLVVLTGSADKTIKMWKGNSPFQVFKGHTDCVRALAVCSSDQFLSAANDATIRLWITSGECLSTFYGHTNYIYGLSLMSDKMRFVSCGEDRSIRIWKLDSPDECQQTVYLPAQSVWAVNTMVDGDIITGSSDGLVRVFTNDPKHYADPETLKTFEEELASTTLSAQQELGGIKLTDLPGPESLFEPGIREGQTKLVREGQNVSCFSWSSSEGQWNKVGDVMGAAGGNEPSDPSKTLHEGKEYDFVFSIDIAEGQPPLKLPYNCTEDPWMAAQKFIHKHDLSQYYLDTVANFIIKHSGGPQRAAAPSAPSATESFYDPFTGGSRYVPPSNNTTAPSVGGGADPFTGSGRYVPASTEVHNNKSSQRSYFPVSECLRFDQANVEAISNKLKEFNAKVDGMLQIAESDLLKFVRLAEKDGNVNALNNLDTLLQWPPEYLIPVLDILRLASRHSPVYQSLVRDSSKYLDILIGLINSSVPNCMLIYRMMAHFVAHHSVDPKIMELRETLLGMGVSAVVNTDPSFTKHPQWKNVQIAFATLMLNYSVLLHNLPSAPLEAKANLLNCIVEVVSKLQDEEALFRTLSAAGTLVASGEDCLAIAQSLELRNSIDHLRNVPGKVSECVKEILALL